MWLAGNPTTPKNHSPTTARTAPHAILVDFCVAQTPTDRPKYEFSTMTAFSRFKPTPRAKPKRVREISSNEESTEVVVSKAAKSKSKSAKTTKNTDDTDEPINHPTNPTNPTNPTIRSFQVKDGLKTQVWIMNNEVFIAEHA